MTSRAKLDSPSTESLFDFLYVDRGRIASYFAQLFDTGVLRSLKTTATSEQSIAEEGHAGFGRIAGYKAKDEKAIGQSTEREFDAEWAVPLNVIDALDERGMISRDVTSAAMGQLVLLSGTLQVIDMRMVKELWKPIAAQEVGNMPSATSQERKKKEEARKSLGSLTDIIANLPHSVQVKLFSDDYQLWATLEPNYIIGSTADLGLKHGMQIQGTWSMLGVLDALPELPSAGEPNLRMPKVPSQLDVAFLKMFIELRKILGRGYFDYGVTPVAILREVGLRSSTSAQPDPVRSASHAR